MSFSADRVELARNARTAIVVPELRGAVTRDHTRDREGRMAEASGLVRAIGVTIVDAVSIAVRTTTPATLLGKGQVNDLAEHYGAIGVDLVIVDAALSPVQQRNLETAFAAKVIDRTALILEIFGERAVTAEGRMQVELAHLDYQQGRLVRSWTHLERQRGGFGFLGGPGETQIEADRRMIRDRMAHIRRNLDSVARTRKLQRQRRKRAPWPVVALVGYTNAGKSTLFNLLSNSHVVAQDMLFATLDPTMRKIDLDGVGKVILSDTVGFVSDLPTQLVAAFRATLEEVLSADLLLHVRDISHPETQQQRQDVLDILGELGIGPMAPGDGDAVTGPAILEVHNKVDLLPPDESRANAAQAARDGAAPLSALTGAGVDALRQRLSAHFGGQAVERQIHVTASDGRLRSWLYDHGDVIAERQQADGSSIMHVRMSPLQDGRLTAQTGRVA